MKLPTVDQIYPFYRYLPIIERDKELSKVNISNIKGLSRKDVTDESFGVEKLVKELKKEKRINFETDDIGLLKLSNEYFVETNGNHRILAIKICEKMIENKFIMVQVSELSFKKKDIIKEKEELLDYLLRKNQVRRYYCRNCDSNFSEKVVNKIRYDIGVRICCPICKGNVI